MFQDKKSFVRDVFSSVASKYDLMNDVMSAGLHRTWKNKMVDLVALESGHKILDIAGGTGDISSRILKKADNNHLDNVLIIMGDINHDMIKQGRNRFLNDNLLKRKSSSNQVEFICCDGEQLSAPDNYFNYYTIAYGIRNFSNIAKGLEEAYRVLNEGGKFICLEFSKVENQIISQFYDLYSFHIIPKFGKYIAGDQESYEYLVDSIRKFPKQSEFVNMMRQAGFKNVEYRDLSMGITTIYIGEK